MATSTETNTSSTVDSIIRNTPSKAEPIVSVDINSTSTTPVSKIRKDVAQELRSSPTLADLEEPDFDPCSTAKPCSPFYLYNHESPRSSFDIRQNSVPKNAAAIHVSVLDLDLEKGQTNVTAKSASTQSLSQEKSNADAGGLRMWTGKGKPTCMTKPQQHRFKAWLKSLPKWQRWSLRAFIALFIIGAMVGIAVGITVSVHGGVYKSANSTSSIGS